MKMTALEIKTVDLILAPTRRTFLLEVRAGVTEPNLFSQGRMNLRFALAAHLLLLHYSERL